MMRASSHPARIGIAGLAVAASYLVAASWTLDAAHPLRPLFDGVHTQIPYRYVIPPTPDPLAIAPEGTTAILSFSKQVVDGEPTQILDGRVVTTGDGQASMSVPSGAIEHVEGATGVRFEITPLEPATLGEPPPGLEYDGNALRMEAVYEPSGDPVTFTPQDCSLGGCLTVIARYAHAGTQLWLHDGSAWREVLDTSLIASSFTIAAPVLQLGTFVVTKIPGSGSGGSNLTMLIAFIAGGLAVVGAVYLQWRRARAARARAKRSSSAKDAARRRAAPNGKGGATRGRARR